jgi:hypothetical protein
VAIVTALSKSYCVTVAEAKYSFRYIVTITTQAYILSVGYIVSVSEAKKIELVTPLPLLKQQKIVSVSSLLLLRVKQQRSRSQGSSRHKRSSYSSGSHVSIPRTVAIGGVAATEAATEAAVI